jgi:hypothetical protein
MKTTEEKLQQLELAHARLFNQFNTLHQDFIKYKDVMQEQLTNLKGLINLSSTEEEEGLPETLITNKEYKAVISKIVKSTPTKWNNKEWTNWELKIEGKDEYVYVAFIPTEHQLAVGDNVRFTYANPFQLKKLRKIK